MGGRGDFRKEPGSAYYHASLLDSAMRAYNERTREVCRTAAVECVDLARVVPKTTDFFFDDCHFTDQAQILIAEIVAEELRRILVAAS